MAITELGQTVRDVITRYEGVVTSRTEYLHGCTRIVVQSREMKDGKPVEDQCFDEQRLEVLPDIPNVLDFAPRTNRPGGDRPGVRQPDPRSY